jgi:hypothetical protein
MFGKIDEASRISWSAVSRLPSSCRLGENEACSRNLVSQSRHEISDAATDPSPLRERPRPPLFPPPSHPHSLGKERVATEMHARAARDVVLPPHHTSRDCVCDSSCRTSTWKDFTNPLQDGNAALKTPRGSAACFSLSAGHKHGGVVARVVGRVGWFVDFAALDLRNGQAQTYGNASGGSEVAPQALLASWDDYAFLQEGFWLIYFLVGLRALVVITQQANCSSSAEHVAMRSAGACTIFEVVERRRGREFEADYDSVLQTLMEAMSCPSTPLECEWACTAALDKLVQQEHDSRLAMRFLQHGGAMLLNKALKLAGSVDSQKRESRMLRCSVGFFIANLAAGNCKTENLMCTEGAEEALTEHFQSGSDAEVRASVWAIGILGGFGAVAKVMLAQNQLNRPAGLQTR